MASKGTTLTPEQEQYLDSKYHDPDFPASFSAPEKFYRAIKQDGQYKIDLNTIKQWLQSVDTYTVHRGVRHNFPRSRVITSGINDLFDIDLVFMRDLKRYNKGYQYLLLAIDVFSRYAYAFPLKSKKPEEIISSLKQLFAQGAIPTSIRSDNGGEFTSFKVRKFLKENNVNLMTTKNYTIKANYVERLAKTIKKKLVKYMYSKQTYKWYDILPKIIEGYNHSYHSSIKMKPADVNENNESSLWKRQYLPPKSGTNSRKKGQKVKLKPFKFKIGDTVRVSFNKTKFSREYDQKWSDQLYLIGKRFRRDGIPVYKLMNFNGQEEVDGTFYQEELQKVRITPNTMYKIEKVIKKKTVDGKRMALVRWLGWEPQYDSYVPVSDLKRFK